jgi:aspartate/methionine/tyrosine aminotransferase
VTNRLFATMPHYERLEAERRSTRRRLFISDYNGTHPYVREYLGDLATRSPLELGEITSYAGIDEDLVVRTKLADLHTEYDGVAYGANNVIPAGGSSGLICTICTWLMLRGYRQVHYVPPVYYKFAFLFDKFGMEPVAVSDQHAFMSDFALRLPEAHTVLILTDPIWYAGRRVPACVLDDLRAWQERTGSTIFVDGSFQYMRWDGARRPRLRADGRRGQPRAHCAHARRLRAAARNRGARRAHPD